MQSPKFSIGYNFDFDGFVNLLYKFKDNIDSVYFPIPKKHLGSGRILDEPPFYKKEIIELIKHCKNLKITPFLLLNSTIVAPSQIRSVIKYLTSLYKTENLRHATVTDPYLMMQIKKEMPKMFIEASTLCRIKTVQEAKYFKEIGVERITSDRELIRNLRILTKLQQILPLKVLANEGCLKNCIYRYSHYDMLSSNIDEVQILPFGKKYKESKKQLEEMDSFCVFTIQKHPHKVFSSPFIRPEDIKRYKEITNIFKLSTRNFETHRIETTLKAYIEQKHNGNLVEILNTSYIDKVFDHIDNNALNKVKFFETLSCCDDDCDKCMFCHELLEKAKVKYKKKE